jgi:hypothetical protein
MRKSILLLFTIGLALNLSAQLGIKKLTISQNFENDMLKGMDFDYFNGLLPADNEFNFRSDQFQKDQINSMSCDNAGVTLEITLSAPQAEWLEWRLGGQYITDKIDAVTYNNTMNDEMGDFVTFNSSFSEAGVHTAVVANLPLKFLRWYAGFGGNMTHSFDKDLCVFGSDNITADNISFQNVTDVRNDVMDESYGFAAKCYDVQNHLSTHMYFVTGGGIVILQTVELGMEMYAGTGIRARGASNLNATGIIGINMRASLIF